MLLIANHIDLKYLPDMPFHWSIIYAISVNYKESNKLAKKYGKSDFFGWKSRLLLALGLF